MIFKSIDNLASQAKMYTKKQDLLKMLFNNERPTGQKHQLLDERTVENKGKLILTEIFLSVQKT